MIVLEKIYMLSMLSNFTRILEEKSADMREYASTFGSTSSYSAIIIIAAFLVGCIIISYFANR